MNVARSGVTLLGSTLLAVSAAALAAGIPESTASPEQRSFSCESSRAQVSENSKLYRNARVLVGVDLLGRFLAAIDSDRDGKADDYLMFIEQSRFEGPWSTLLESATVCTSRGVVRIEADNLAFGAALAMKEGAQPALIRSPDVFAQSFVRWSGVALLQVHKGPSEGVPLADLNVTNIYTWPYSFQQQEDLLEPENAI